MQSVVLTLHPTVPTVSVPVETEWIQPLCFFCTCPLQEKVFHKPLKVSAAANRVETDGSNYCSVRCVLSAIRSQGTVDLHNQYTQEQWLYSLYCRDENGRIHSSIELLPAPDPKGLLKKFGGTWSEETYQASLQLPVVIYSLPFSVVHRHKELVELTDQQFEHMYGITLHGHRSGIFK